jgi:hypothetical protein
MKMKLLINFVYNAEIDFKIMNKKTYEKNSCSSIEIVDRRWS